MSPTNMGLTLAKHPPNPTANTIPKPIYSKIMKPLTYSILAAAFACGFASAQVTAYTTPVGYTTQTLAASTYNLVGFNVLTPTLAAGTLTGVSGATLTDTNVNFTTLLTAGKTYVIDITTGTAAGTVQEFVSWGTPDVNSITLPSAVAGIAVGNSYAVRIAPTLQDIFTTVLSSSLSAGNADIVWVPDGAGGYTKYWMKNGTPPVWHTTVTGSTDGGLVTGDVPLPYIDGVLVQKKLNAGTLVLSGEVKKTGSSALIAGGGLYNLVSVVPPVGVTLFTSGLQGNIASSLSAGNADIVWVPDGAGNYAKYWLKNGTPTIWHTTVTGASDTGLATDVNLPAAIFIQRKGASTVVPFTVPASYSSL